MKELKLSVLKENFDKFILKEALTLTKDNYRDDMKLFWDCFSMTVQLDKPKYSETFRNAKDLQRFVADRSKNDIPYNMLEIKLRTLFDSYPNMKIELTD